MSPNLPSVKSNAAKQEQLVEAPSFIPQPLEFQAVSNCEGRTVNDRYLKQPEKPPHTNWSDDCFERNFAGLAGSNPKITLDLGTTP